MQKQQPATQLSFDDVLRDRDCENEFRRYLLAHKLPIQAFEFVLETTKNDIFTAESCERLYKKYAKLLTGYQQKLTKIDIIKNAKNDIHKEFATKIFVDFVERDIILNAMKNIVLECESSNKEYPLVKELEAEMHLINMPPQNPKTLETLFQQFETYFLTKKNKNKDLEKNLKRLAQKKTIKEKRLILLEIEKQILSFNQI